MNNRVASLRAAENLAAELEGEDNVDGERNEQLCDLSCDDSQVTDGHLGCGRTKAHESPLRNWLLHGISYLVCKLSTRIAKAILIDIVYFCTFSSAVEVDLHTSHGLTRGCVLSYLAQLIVDVFVFSSNIS